MCHGTRLASAAEHDGVRSLVAFVADLNQIDVALLLGMGFSRVVGLTGIGADRPTHAEVNCAAAAIGFLDDNGSLAAAGTREAERALPRGLPRVLRTGDVSDGIEPALACVQGRIVRSHRGSAVG